MIPELAPEVAELLLAGGGAVLNLFVIPSVLDSDAQIPRTQSVPFALVLLFGFTYSYYSLGLYFPMVMTAIGSVMWGYLAVFRPIEPNE